jgi:hypothetical protein
VPGGQSSVYFDLKVSNTTDATVSIRHIGVDTWVYEITHISRSGYTPIRGSIDWRHKDPDRPDYLYLVSKVLGNYYADLSEQGIWQE